VTRYAWLSSGTAWLVRNDEGARREVVRDVTRCALGWLDDAVLCRRDAGAAGDYDIIIETVHGTQPAGTAIVTPLAAVAAAVTTDSLVVAPCRGDIDDVVAVPLELELMVPLVTGDGAINGEACSMAVAALQSCVAAALDTAIVALVLDVVDAAAAAVARDGGHGDEGAMLIAFQDALRRVRVTVTHHSVAADTAALVGRLPPTMAAMPDGGLLLVATAWHPGRTSRLALAGALAASRRAAIEAALGGGGSGGPSVLWNVVRAAPPPALLHNVHRAVPPPAAWAATHAVTLARGCLDYYHYGAGGVADSGWGCAYRVLQLQASWARYAGLAPRDAPPPSHGDIQRALVAAGDKPPSFVGSRAWIGSVEAGIVLGALLRLPHRIVHAATAADLPAAAATLARHFRDVGSPVLMGGGVLAHAILGVALPVAGAPPSAPPPAFLVADPHYTGPDDAGHALHKPVALPGGYRGPAVAWRPLTSFANPTFYNFCCPLLPPAAGV